MKKWRIVMTISERVFERLEQINMSQKEFAEKTGIRQSTISEWKKNRTNPSSDKIMGICEALGVSPGWLLSGVDSVERGKNTQEYYVIDKDTEIGYLISKTKKYPKDFPLDSSESTEYVREEILNWTRHPDSDVELSIIFPVYNISKYLPQCIESVTAWQADYVEYLFVDDGSPDNSADIIRDYASKDPRIKLLQKENGGCASARQFGLERASGKYIGFIDPDDYVDESMFPKLFRRALIGSYEISYCGYNEHYETTGEIQPVVIDVLWSPFDEGTSRDTDINYLIAFRRIAIWRGIYLKEMLDRSGIRFHTDLRRFDDLPFKVETMASARSVVSIPEFLYFYRMARPGQDVSADDERLFVHFQIFKYLDEFISKAKNRSQIEYLQVVKIHTHKWALTKLKPEFIASYCEKARDDILTNMSFVDSCTVAMRYTSKNDQLFHLAICRNNLPMLRYLIKHYKP